MQLDYSVSEKWYQNVYSDKKECRSSARSFSLTHDKRTNECWLLIHGYRGYPGELVRPAEDLFNIGFDVFVPRLPGNGTSGDDFIKTKGKDWITLAQNALDDLSKQYEKVNLLGHSMGSSIVAIIGCNNPSVGKIVLVSPSFKNLQMPFYVRIILKLASLVTARLNAPWHANPKQRLHYENAPCDNDYYGKEYWQYYFTKQLGSYYRLGKQSLRCLVKYPHEHLLIVPERDKVISKPSEKLYKKKIGNRASVINIPNGSHVVFYDVDPIAEQLAVDKVLTFALKH